MTGADLGTRGSAIRPSAPAALLVAQLDEIAPLLRRLAARRAGGVRAASYWSGVHEGRPIAVAVSGMGRRRARAAAAALLDRSGASQLLVVGVAGALTAGLEVGELVVAQAIATERDAVLRAEPGDLRPARELGARPVCVVTVDRMVATPEDRRALLRWVPAESPRPRSGAGEGAPSETAGGAWPERTAGAVAPAVVDMESYDAVVEAIARGVPATVLRAVSDTAADTLPSFLERCRRPDGDLDRRRVVLGAVMRPRSIPALLELRRRVLLCAERLADPTLRLLAPSRGSGEG